MRKRQLKKFAKQARATRNITAYRKAHGRGSKALCRRWKCMKRHASPAPPEIKAMREAVLAVNGMLKTLRETYDKAHAKEPGAS